MSTTRRDFLSKTVFGALGAGIALRAFHPESLVAYAQSDVRTYQAAKYGIMIDGALAGWLESVEGGRPSNGAASAGKFGLVAQNTAAAAMSQEITLACGMGMSPAFHDWIKSAFDEQSLRKNGAILTCDYNFKEVSRLEFTNALISHVAFPALDGSSKDPGKMTISLSAESTRMGSPSGGTAVANPRELAAGKQKQWLCSNFRLKIDSLDCSRVNKIEAISVQTFSAGPSTAIIRPAQIPGGTTPNLVFTVPEADAAPLYAWQKASLIGSSAKRSGQLDFLTPNLSESLFSLTFGGMTLRNIVPDKVLRGGETLRHVTAQAYCEKIDYVYRG